MPLSSQGRGGRKLSVHEPSVVGFHRPSVGGFEDGGSWLLDGVAAGALGAADAELDWTALGEMGWNDGSAGGAVAGLSAGKLERPWFGLHASRPVRPNRQQPNTHALHQGTLAMHTIELTEPLATTGLVITRPHWRLACHAYSFANRITLCVAAVVSRPRPDSPGSTTCWSVSATTA